MSNVLISKDKTRKKFKCNNYIRDSSWISHTSNRWVILRDFRHIPIPLFTRPHTWFFTCTSQHHNYYTDMTYRTTHIIQLAIISHFSQRFCGREPSCPSPKASLSDGQSTPTAKTVSSSCCRPCRLRPTSSMADLLSREILAPGSLWSTPASASTSTRTPSPPGPSQSSSAQTRTPQRRPSLPATLHKPT